MASIIVRIFVIENAYIIFSSINILGEWMPFYDYSCKSCNHKFESLHKIDERHLPCESDCPECHKSGSVEIIVGSPIIGDPIRLGITKPSGAFKERMDFIKTIHPLGTYRY